MGYGGEHNGCSVQTKKRPFESIGCCSLVGFQAYRFFLVYLQTLLFRYHHTLPELPVDTGSSSRDSPSSDKENRNARSSPRKAPRSPLKLPVKTLSPRKANGSPKSPIKSPSLQQEHCSPKPPMKVMSPRKCNATPKSPAKTLSPRKASGSPRSPVKSLSSLESSVFLELPSGVFDRVSGWTSPFTGKTFDAVEDLEQHLQRSYSAFKFEKIVSSLFHMPSRIFCYLFIHLRLENVPDIRNDKVPYIREKRKCNQSYDPNISKSRPGADCEET